MLPPGFFQAVKDLLFGQISGDFFDLHDKYVPDLFPDNPKGMGESNPRIKQSLPAQGRKFAGIQGKSAHAIEFLSQLFRVELNPEAL